MKALLAVSIVICMMLDNAFGIQTGDENKGSDSSRKSKILFQENFDQQNDWRTISSSTVGDLPAGWDYAYTAEKWHPSEVRGSQPSMMINGNDPDQVFGKTGKSFINYLESFNDISNNGFASDGFISKDIEPTDELFVQFEMKFQPGFAAKNEDGLIKIFRASSYDGVGLRSKFFSSGNSAPIYIFDWSQNKYGLRHVHAFRCDDQETNYFGGDPKILDPPRQIINGDMSANFVEDISRFKGRIPDLVNGGFLPKKGTIYHNQILGSKWHEFAFHLKQNSAPGVQDGILRVWLDRHMIINMEKIPWIGNKGDMKARWNNVSFGGNDRYHFNLDENAPVSERERWYAIDEILVLDKMPN